MLNAMARQYGLSDYGDDLVVKLSRSDKGVARPWFVSVWKNAPLRKSQRAGGGYGATPSEAFNNAMKAFLRGNTRLELM